MVKEDIGVVDLFCGIGGLSYGMFKSGFKILAGYDIDSTCKYAYEHNNKAKFYSRDIAEVTGAELNDHFKNSKIKILAGCAPCQPFSSYAFKVKDKDEAKYDLLYHFGRLVEETLPDIVTMENVSQITSFKLKPVLLDFVAKLEANNYKVTYKTIYCPDFGIPQTRKRLVLLASRLGDIEIIKPTHTKEEYINVKQAIGHLPKIEAGQACDNDRLHRSRSLSELNLKRIKATPYGGGWKDWPEELVLECHKKESGKSFGSVYGRMVWDEPSPTMTTLCTGLGNGRFGHPEQDRALSIREAALLQTFPSKYKFFKNEDEISISKASRYIGNAVPPKLGEVTATSIKLHLEKFGLL